MFIVDPSGALSQNDLASIDAMSSPLDVKVIVTSAESKPGLDAHVHDLVTSANTLAIGVDPVHHYTFTHFGTGTGISLGDYQGVARAGNGEFHAGHWADGIRAIVNAANAASSEGAHGTVLVTEPTTVVEHPSAAWPYLLGLGVLAALCLVAWRWMRRKSLAIENAAQEARDEAQEMRSRNIEEQGWHDALKPKMPPVPAVAPVASTPPSVSSHRSTRSTRPTAPPRYAPAPNYAPAAVPIIVNQGTNDGLLAGLLIGESMSRPAVVEREVIHETPSYERDTGSDGGSSSSSFDSGSSFDGGSSGGGFDSGSGGGGFDGGGSGGNF